MPAKTTARPASAQTLRGGSAASKRSTGGNGLTNDLAKLSIPFGIVLAQNGLRNYLDQQKRATKAAPKEKKVSGGADAPPMMLDGGKKKKTATKSKTSKK